MTGHCPGRVPPFGYLRIVARLQLPEAFRSWPRPSSAYGALASTLRSSSLDCYRRQDPETNCLSFHSVSGSPLSLPSAHSVSVICLHIPSNWPFSRIISSLLCSCQGAVQDRDGSPSGSLSQDPENDTGSSLLRSFNSAPIQTRLRLFGTPTSPCCPLPRAFAFSFSSVGFKQLALSVRLPFG